MTELLPRSRRLLTSIAAVICLASCWGSESQLRTLAASDFDCAPEQLAVSEGDSGVHRVRGCGHDASYVYNAEAKAWLRAEDAGARVITRER
jgi:hypothetical protein